MSNLHLAHGALYELRGGVKTLVSALDYIGSAHATSADANTADKLKSATQVIQEALAMLQENQEKRYDIASEAALVFHVHDLAKELLDLCEISGLVYGDHCAE